MLDNIKINLISSTSRTTLKILASDVNGTALLRLTEKVPVMALVGNKVYVHLSSGAVQKQNQLCSRGEGVRQERS